MAFFLGTNIGGNGTWNETQFNNYDEARSNFLATFEDRRDFNRDSVIKLTDKPNGKGNVYMETVERWKPGTAERSTDFANEYDSDYSISWEPSHTKGYRYMPEDETIKELCYQPATGYYIQPLEYKSPFDY